MVCARPKKWVLFNGVAVKDMKEDNQGLELDLTDCKIGSEGGMVLVQMLVTARLPLATADDFRCTHLLAGLLNG